MQHDIVCSNLEKLPMRNEIYQNISISVQEHYDFDKTIVLLQFPMAVFRSNACCHLYKIFIVS